MGMVGFRITKSTMVHAPEEAFHIPALKVSIKKRYLPTRMLMLSMTERINAASTTPQIIPRKIRTAKNETRCWR